MKPPGLWSPAAVVMASLGLQRSRYRLAARDLAHLRHAVRAEAPLAAPVSYLRAGDPAGVRVILVHGTPGGAKGWHDYLLEPPEGTEVLALDRPGFGRSGPNAAVTSLACQAAAVAALLPTDGRRAVLLGHSLGGAVVAQVAALYPQRVGALVLLASALDPALERVHWLQRLGARWPVRPLMSRALRNANQELLHFKAELAALAPRLSDIRASTLVVHGTADDLVPFANVDYIARMFSGVRSLHTRVLAGCDHFLPWNAEGDVRQALRLASQPEPWPT